MNSTIVYSLNDTVINPECVGLIREIMPNSYEIESCNVIPEIVQKVYNYFIFNEYLDFEYLNCVSQYGINMIDFFHLNLDERNMLYFFFCVKCEVDSDVYFTVESHALQRLWVNNKMVFFCGHGQREIYTLHLQAGINVFCIQQHDAIPDIKSTFRIRSLIADKNDDISLTDGNLLYIEGKIGVDVKYLNEYQYEGKDYNFFLYPIDCVNLDDNIEINVIFEDHITGETLYEQKCYLYQPYSISTSQMEYKTSNLFNRLDVIFRYINKAGKGVEARQYIYLTPLLPFLPILKEKASNLLDRNLKLVEECFVKYVISYPDNNENMLGFIEWEWISKALDCIENNTFENLIYSEGEKRICYHSIIDDTYEYYTITLPKGYNRKKKYPLIIINNVLNGAWLSSFFSRAKELEVIAVDFNGRGITLGSYVGDAAFNEIYTDVLSKYNIDNTKIIMMGHSNGGYATWAQAQMIPDRFAAIYPAASEPNHKALMNLNNIGVRYLTSDSEHLNHKVVTELKKQADRYIGDYKTLWVEKYNHGLFGQIQFSERIISQLVNESSREDYPNRIHFYTNKNRYLRSYWIDIHSIEYGSTFAEVHVEINENVINIHAENITGITITVPPQIDKLDGVIIINDECFNINGKDNVILHNNANSFELVSEKKKGIIFKGTGVIDPFIKPVRIINFLKKKHNDILNNFQTPSTNGFYGSAYVKYPVLEIDKLRELPKHSLIILDNCSAECSILNDIKSKIRIEMDEFGYSYLGKRYTGEYLIMQIVEHPTELDNSILYINTNNEELYEKCFFTRKIVLPAYSNGYHPYLNSNAIIFNGKTYFTVPEYGLEITAYN